MYTLPEATTVIMFRTAQLSQARLPYYVMGVILYRQACLLVCWSSGHSWPQRSLKSNERMNECLEVGRSPSTAGFHIVGPYMWGWTFDD